ncbi:MAG: ribosome small subunit-dependent GTPase A [Oscillospiraceae bacterium]|nr:ribosome small subunit-dependent GTPase A [Oscillospiraceae bacterium]
MTNTNGILDMAGGVVYKALSGFYYVESEEGIVECRARGKFRLEKESPFVGDRVEYTPTEPGKGFLTAIYPRKNIFVRPAIANIDIMVIIASAVIPVTDPFLIDRMSVVSENNGCKSIICLNKCDLDPADKLYDIYSSAGFHTIRTSAQTGEGLMELLNTISNAVCVFTGNSGVGKSSILNRLDPSFQIAVNEVSQKLGRGKHTTRHVELFKLPGGAVIGDTPGFSAFDTERIAPKEDIQYLFPDFDPYVEECRFHDCAHIKEPDCAILEALEAGLLQKTRHESYIRLYEQAKEYKEWEQF